MATVRAKLLKQFTEMFSIRVAMFKKKISCWYRGGQT